MLGPAAVETIMQLLLFPLLVAERGKNSHSSLPLPRSLCRPCNQVANAIVIDKTPTIKQRTPKIVELLGESERGERWSGKRGARAECFVKILYLFWGGVEDRQINKIDNILSAYEN